VSGNQKGRRSLIKKSGLTRAIALVATSLVLAVGQSGTFSSEAIAKHSADRTPVSEEIIGGKTFSVAREVIKASPEQIWQILTDHANAPKTFPMLKKSQLIEDHGDTKIVKHVLSPSGLPCNYEYVIEIKETKHRSMEWHRVSGAFKQVDGHWKLEPMDGGRHTMVTYASHVNGGLFAPQGLIRRQFRIDMPTVMAQLKSQSENVTHIAGRPHAANQ